MQQNSTTNSHKRFLAPQFFATPNKGLRKDKRAPQYTLIASKSSQLTPRPKSRELSASISAAKSLKLINAENSTTSLELNPKIDKVDHITNEILDALKQKLSYIQEQQKIQADKKKMLNVALAKSKDELQVARGQIEACQKTLLRITYNNQKLQEDCKELEDEINVMQENITSIQRDSGDNIALLKSEIFAVNIKREKETAALYRERDESTSYEKSLIEQRAIRQQQVDEISKEVNELKQKLRDATEREGSRLEKFLNKIHSIDVSISVIKTTGTIHNPL